MTLWGGYNRDGVFHGFLATRTGANGSTLAATSSEYVVDDVSHGFLLSGGDILGRYTVEGVTRAYLLVGFRPACVTGDSGDGASAQLAQKQARDPAISRPVFNPEALTRR